MDELATFLFNRHFKFPTGAILSPLVEGAPSEDAIETPSTQGKSTHNSPQEVTPFNRSTQTNSPTTTKMPLLRSLATKAGIIRTPSDRETKLEQGGKWREAQKLRFKHFTKCAREVDQDKQIYDLIRADQRILFQVQARAAQLKTEKDAASGLQPQPKSSSTARPAKVARLESKLLESKVVQSVRWSSSDTAPKQLQKECLDGSCEAIWVAEHHRHNMLSQVPEGPAKRAYLSLHQQSGWHLSKWQRSECAAVGGCCARDCGCCTRSRCPDLPTLYHGHCLSYCPCCAKARGFTITPDSIDDDKMLPEIKLYDWCHGNHDYVSRVMNAHIWGL
ncbi:hypothetical protein BO82DRAFT_362399 [Aspergillus uvarum CBS 121591]|uniref:Uncharacterized protein n=1 Tax=Aspergillus uvarum CBS 121591 TaxID=1448315 RepID=A0A319CFM5_9EURO|nr:hypothetical protein BO82DRAFT_362399 [Aspergillus uvarum CBS 121591]PYH84656.1 hypothetical protein BO82DRAFT_362399 [Aspergillus uvarum CBS 121591]